MNAYTSYLSYVQKQQQPMLDLLTRWAAINSCSDNLEGLSQMLSEIKHAFAPLNGSSRIIQLPPYNTINSQGDLIEKKLGNALAITKHPNASIKVFLGGHMDTVYPKDHPFQTTKRINENTLQGPGVADMKGGLIILLKALEALENSPYAGKIGWEVLINPDEEIGSIGSKPLFEQSARNNHLGLLFEPSFSDGSLVSERKGSMNCSVIVRGRAAHAGRDFHSGRNAISALAGIVIEAEALNDKEKGITVNIGYIEGGGPVNIVPDLAIGRFNMRMDHVEDLHFLRRMLRDTIVPDYIRDGISATYIEHGERPPKPFDEKQIKLFETVRHCAKDLGITIQWKPSGGVCDGNILASQGLPTIDTLGAIGGNIHTSEEYVVISSLTERATLVAYFLMRLANKEITL